MQHRGMVLAIGEVGGLFFYYSTLVTDIKWCRFARHSNKITMRVYIVTKPTLIFILVCINPQNTMIFFYKFYRNFTITFFTG